MTKNTTTLKLIERLRKFTETKTDYAVAKMLGLNHQSMIHYKKGTQFDEATTLIACEIMELDYMSIRAQIRFEMERSERKRDVWRPYLKRLLVAATSIGFSVATGKGIIQEVKWEDNPFNKTSVMNTFNQTESHYIHYAHKGMRKIMSFIKKAAFRLLAPRAVLSCT